MAAEYAVIPGGPFETFAETGEITDGLAGLTERMSPQTEPAAGLVTYFAFHGERPAQPGWSEL